MTQPAAEPPTIADAKAIIERLRPRDRAMLRPWLLARFTVGGDVHRDVVEREQAEPEEHRLRR